MKRYIIMKRTTSVYGSKYFVNDDWERETEFYLMDEYSNKYPIVAHYYHALDLIEYFCEGTQTTAYESVRRFIKENSDGVTMIITNPFKVKY